MTDRPLRESDIPILQEFARLSGFPYPEFDHPHIEAIVVIADSEDKPILACAAKKLVEQYLWINPNESASVKIHALRLAHKSMAEKLRALYYSSTEAFVPEIVSGKFGRRLERTFGWIKNWQSWTIKF